MRAIFCLCLISSLYFTSRASGQNPPAFDWQRASPESQGMSAAKLDALKAKVARTSKAFLVIRNDKLVYEWYAEGHSATTKHYTASMAKAIVGGLSLAVTMNDGLIKLDDPVSRFVPQWKHDPQKAKILIRHLGSHTSGLDDAHIDGVPHEKLPGWMGEFWKRNAPPGDPFTLSRDNAPVLFAAGEKFHYSNPGIGMLTYAVTAALKDAPLQDVRTLLRERIMRPIGVPDADWSVGYGQTVSVEGLPLVGSWGGGAYTARATARVGRLVLRKGDWDGKRLLSAQSIHEMTADAGFPGHCGMGWWTNGDRRLPGVPADAVWGLGAGHQVLFVVPSLNLIMVRNGGDLFQKSEGRNRLSEILFEPVIDAVVEPSKSSALPYPRSRTMRGVEFDFATHRRLAPGSDNWPLTWADDGHQYAAWGDGGGFGGTNSAGRVLLGVARIEGDPADYSGKNVWGGAAAANPAQFGGKSYGLLCVDKVLYMWVASQPAKHLQSCQLAWSKDHGAHWQLADWSFRYADGLSIPTFLNFGKNYAGARDDYVYSYYIKPTWGPGESTTGNYGFDVHRPGQLYLSRVRKDEILERSRYEFFSGYREDGAPQWTADVARKTPVFADANGVGWNVSAVFAPAAGRYLLCTEHTATHVGKLGIFDAPTPWGPWTTVAYDDAWGQGHIEVSSFYWSFPAKWQADDGKFTMVFTGKNSNDSWNTVRGRFVTSNTAEAEQGAAPYSKSPVVVGIEWAPAASVIRRAKGCDNWPLTWADDGDLYGAYGDGNGFEPFLKKKLGLGLAKIAGGPDDFRGTNLVSPSIEQLGEGAKGKKASGLLMVDGVLYLWLRNAQNSQLAWSKDHGQTWAFAEWKLTTGFGCPTFLNYGRNYAGARDEFVYAYSSDSDSAYDPSDRMVMARVPRGRIADRSAYEFLVDVDARGTPRWTSDITQRGAVFTHRGKCYRTGITFNAGLKRYVWCHVYPESRHPQGPRFQGGFGIYDAPEPWGPWTTIFHTDDWDMGPGETSSFPAKWMSDDGKTMHLVFSGDDYFSVRQAKLTLK